MSNKFEWRTEEEAWEELDARAESAGAPAATGWRAWQRSPWVRLLLLMMIPVLLGSWYLLQRVGETREEVTADLLATRDLLLDAALDHDAERLALVLSEQDLQWHQLQRVYLRRGLLFDRPPLHLWLDEGALRARPAGEAAADVRLAPDLATAEVDVALPYLTETAAGTLQPLTLVQTLHLAYEGGRWLRVPPPEASWGETERYDGRFVGASFPARDRDLSQAIAAAVDERYGALCAAETTVPCPLQPHLALTFTTDAAALRSLSQPVQGNRFWIFGARQAAGERFAIELPAPSLVGLPGDEAARQVLVDSYAGYLLTAYLARKQPQLPFEQIAARLDLLDLRLPPPPGYRPPPAAADLPLPDGEIVLSCVDDGQVAGQWLYRPADGRWQPCPSCEADLETLFGAKARSEMMRFERANERVGRLLPSHAAGQEADSGELVRPFMVNDGTIVFLSGGGSPAAAWNRQGGTAAEERILFARLHDGPVSSGVTVMQEASEALLRPALPEGRRVGRLRLDAVLPDPAASDRLLVLAGNGAHEQFVFRIGVERMAVTLLANWVDNGSNFGAARVTEDGRFLTVMRYRTRSSTLTLVDLVTGRRRIMELDGGPLARYTWSGDGQWLAVADDRLLRLLAPADGFELTVQHPHQGCTAVAWQ